MSSSPLSPVTLVTNDDRVARLNRILTAGIRILPGAVDAADEKILPEPERPQRIAVDRRTLCHMEFRSLPPAADKFSRTCLSTLEPSSSCIDLA